MVDNHPVIHFFILSQAINADSGSILAISDKIIQ